MGKAFKKGYVTSYQLLLQEEFDVDEMAATVRLSGGKVGSIIKDALYGFTAELEDDILDIVSNYLRPPS